MLVAICRTWETLSSSPVQRAAAKSTLAQHLARQLGWESASEDTYWVDNVWGSGLRTPAQEEVVQRQVVEHLLAVCRSGRSVVLEFVLYAAPPNPLTAYQQALAENSVACQVMVIVLKPTGWDVGSGAQSAGVAGACRRTPSATKRCS